MTNSVVRRGFDMFKSYIVFRAGLQPTIAQVKTWNAQVHLLKGVHWGTERHRPDVLAVEVDTESLHCALQQDSRLECLLADWTRQGAEVCERFDFAADRNALKPVKKVAAKAPVSVRFLPDLSVRFWMPKPSAKLSCLDAAPADKKPSATSTQLQRFSRLESAVQGTGRVGPWLFAGVFTIGTLLAGTYIARELRRTGMERRHETIERMDETLRR